MLAQDRLGHRFSLNYEGRETHNTWLGTALSFVINILVLTILAQKSLEMVFMTDPEVQVATRPMLLKEVAELGEINLAKHKMSIGFVSWRYAGQYGDDGFDATGREIEIEELGGTYEAIPSDLISFIVQNSTGYHDSPLSDCKDSFPNMISNDFEGQEFMKKVKCFNPETTIIESNLIYED